MALKVLKNPDLADDVILNVFEGLCNVTSNRVTDAYAKSLTRWRTQDMLLQQQRQAVPYGLLQDRRPLPRKIYGDDSDYERVEKRVDIHAALDRVPGVVCKLLRMRYVECMTFAEIAHIMQCSRSYAYRLVVAACDEIEPYLRGYEDSVEQERQEEMNVVLDA